MMSANPLGNLVRTVPFDLSDLPPHPNIPQDTLADTTSPSSNPPLLTFLRAILDEASTFLSPPTFATTFASLSTKPSPPSTSPVELYKREIPSSELSSINWSDKQPIPRKKPATIEAENWFARRSFHNDESSKTKEGSASWSEFVFGLKEQHSKHEKDFTPTLYDAHHVLDWNEEIKALLEPGSGGERGINGEFHERYTDITMEIFEMCHSLPGPLSPRCFPVLVLTAQTTPTSFLAVSVPVHLSSSSSSVSYYSSGRHSSDPSASPQQRKKPVFGVYAAVETVRILPRKEDGTQPDGKLEVEVGEEEGSRGKAGMIEWTMATASDTKGYLPMFLQKPNLPAALAKDVGLFMDWIKGVDGEAERGRERGRVTERKDREGS